MDSRRRPDPTTCDVTTEPIPGRVSDTPFRSLDHATQAMIARATFGLSPAALTLAFADWLIHLIAAPGKRLELASLTASNVLSMTESVSAVRTDENPASPAAVTSHDHRFRGAAWQLEPFRFWQQSFFLAEQWWSAATHEVPGTTRHHEDVVSFAMRQVLDIFSPANFPMTNPEVVERTVDVFGMNFAKGFFNALEDFARLARHDPPVTFVLTSGGHNAGIVNEPGHPHRQFRMSVTDADAMYVGPVEWVATARVHDGSWWPAWVEWLDEHSSAKRSSPPRMGLPDVATPTLEDAPGTYVFQR
ncbi:poly-beta-hydroxybutyrate polymerase N-terminal domain-containing protein [Trinickia sp. LjRoot230]|uniref:poly-beta-hydroxybutyrate polymerase N-terminal domain-containing protein n=1 Tax=Trinickia sp. LjRoot230 TaxID=3342288 RepID=UPI003ECDB1FE